MNSSKRVLVCDDSDDQYTVIRASLLAQGYDVQRSKHWRSLTEDVRNLSPVQLVVLDLRFDPEPGFTGHFAVEPLVAAFPHIKVILYSVLFDELARRAEAEAISGKMGSIPQVVDLAGVSEPARLVFLVNKALGTSKWVGTSGALSFIQISDMHFGGVGVEKDWSGVAHSVGLAIDSFFSSYGPEGPPADLCVPGFLVVTGDVSHKARPLEFSAAAACLKDLGAACVGWAPQLQGLLGGSRTSILAPGNHDFNWDISRAQDLRSDRQPDGTWVSTYHAGLKDPELAYIREYAWEPYARFMTLLESGGPRWFIDPGYRLLSLKNEAGILFVVVNSSLWGVSHNSANPIVGEPIWLAVRKEVQQIDPNHQCTRILVIHHSLSAEPQEKDRVSIGVQEYDRQRLLHLLVASCGFDLALSGHGHRCVVEWLRAQGTKGRMLHVGSGTLRSHDTRRYDPPSFNLVSLFRASPRHARYSRCSVATFEWSGTAYTIAKPFADDKSLYLVEELVEGDD